MLAPLVDIEAEKLKAGAITRSGRLCERTGRSKIPDKFMDLQASKWRDKSEVAHVG